MPKVPPAEDRLAQLTQRAIEALAIDATPAAVAALKSRLAPLATELMMEWMLGEKRFETQSQQTEYWLSRLYDEIFTDEQPEATRIYSRLGFTLPKAAHVARLLRARTAAAWRSGARSELAARFREFEASAREQQKKGRAHVQEYDVGLSQGAAEELRVRYDRLTAAAGASAQPRPPKAKSSYGASRWLAVPAETLLLVLQQLDAEGARP